MCDTKHIPFIRTLERVKCTILVYLLMCADVVAVRVDYIYTRYTYYNAPGERAGVPIHT